MREQTNCLYDFEPFRIDPLKRKLLCNGQDLQIKSKAFDTLLFLVQRQGEVVSKDELMSAVWSDTIVEENNLTQQISTLRKKFSEHAAGGEHEFIVTMPKQGYKFAQPVKEIFRDGEDIILREVTKSSITIDICEEKNSELQKKQGGSRSFPRFLFFPEIREILLGSILAVMVVFTSIYIEDYRNNSITPLQRSIAVMDFEALDGNEKSSFYSTGITRTLTAKIGNMETMILRPVGSSGRFFGQERDVIAEGHKLGVDVVLEGSVQNDGERVRVAVIAWDMKANRKLWGEVFTKDAPNAFSFQDEISEEIISAIQTRLLN
jgi:DNA-binding winged helix-turn-helix (wHTH) protein/TolB-like protein